MKSLLRRIRSTLCAAGLSAALLVNASGCAYANIKIPFDDDLNNTHLGTKVGKASVRSICWLVAWGDESIAAAAKEGNITTLNHADQEIFIVLWGLYSQHTMIVYGD
ncbi:MAG: TRL domain-containing protein [Bdellovibrionota bacterium]